MPKFAAALLGALLLTLPVTTLADDTGALQNQSTGGLTAPGGASSLGPAGSGSAGSGQAGSSSADSSALQPAGTSPLQSTTSDSNGLTAPSSNTLQAPATGNSALQVIAGDADGSPHQTSTSTPWWLWLLFSLLFGAIAAAAIWFVRQRRAPRQAHPLTSAPPPTELTTSQRLKIVIQAPPAKVFKFALNPNKTPEWVNDITAEEASDHPAKLGTIYRNRSESGDWTEYEVTRITANELFELENRDTGYHVRYTFAPSGDHATELEYYEWVDTGLLKDPFTNDQLHKLKSLLEA